jgi:hypothetical protein
VFILAPDDMTFSKDETKPAPRENVLFEHGLFMGVLGRERVFLVYDQAVGLKIPSDLAGIRSPHTIDRALKGQRPQQPCGRQASLSVTKLPLSDFRTLSASGSLDIR